MEHDTLAALIDKAVFDYHLIEEGDRILVGASGGKDSTLLVEYFAQRMKRFTDVQHSSSAEPRFSFTALNIQTEIGEQFSDQLQNSPFIMERYTANKKNRSALTAAERPHDELLVVLNATAQGTARLRNYKRLQ